MKNRFITVSLLLVLLASLTGIAQATSSPAKGGPALVYVATGTSDDLTRFASTHLPLYAQLEHGLLTAADPLGQQALHAAGLSIQVLDSALRPGMYYLANTLPGRPAPDYASFGQVLLDTGQGVLLSMDASRAAALAKAGAELQSISLTPKPLPATQAQELFPQQVEPDPLIQGMIDQVTTTQVYTYDRQLAGELPVWVDGSWYTISTRATNSGTPIQKTTNYVGQHMADLGMDVDYHVWSSPTAPDVVGEMTGLVNPDDIFIIGAHIDDVNGTPGADDNASGSVATLIAADILSQYQWGCTLRFAFWTGEEQGLLGSAAYAQEAYNAGENILGYLNLDMIAWNTPDSPRTIYLGYRSSVPGSHELAILFDDVLDAYAIPLLPTIGTSYDGSSDHTSFLDYNYPAILGIEGADDFNPYYHGPSDTPAHTDPAYFTDYVKASIATYAHMSNCLIPSGVGQLDGHVTAAEGGTPIAEAKLTAEDSNGHSFPAITDETGYYTRTLLSGTYTVTASAYSYLPATVSGVSITTDTLTTQDFSLASAPTFIVSGTVTEANTGLPLLAEISFDGSPTVVWTDPSTGFYQAELPEDSYAMHVRADLHRPQEREILLDQDQTQDFTLEQLPCILLVDDDQNDPDLNSYYTVALDALGADYDVWDAEVSGDPSAVDIAGYRKLLWYTGGPSYGTFSADNEAAVSSYLDAGGNFFLSSHEYLWENGLTPFGSDYLHILSYTNDLGQTTVTGANVFAGLGPYTLTYPFTNWSDRVSPQADALLAFSGNQGDAGISYAGDAFKSAFVAFPFEAISTPAGRQAVMGRLLDFFGSCQAQDGWLDGHVTDYVTGDPMGGVSVTAALLPDGAGIQAITDPNGYYTMTLPAGMYEITAQMAGFDTLILPASITAGQVTTLDFVLHPSCLPLSDLDFVWQPIQPVVGEEVIFDATVLGAPPVDFAWSFGDTYTATGPTVTHTYTLPGIYTVDLTATNACSSVDLSKDVTVQSMTWDIFLPLVSK